MASEVQALLEKAQKADISEKERLVLELGRLVKWDESRAFKALVREVLTHDDWDTTRWRVIAVKILIEVAMEKDIPLKLKNGTRQTQILKYPASEAMVSQFARDLVHGYT
ncbi:MAG: hypothetical protein ACXAEN_22695 [Candidatus Thorarchaeota archaeon]|jgi:hypothetical protein